MITKQEMFALAWRGLASQGWRKAWDVCFNEYVYYDVRTGRRCAWGWVDPEGTQSHPAARGDVLSLAALGVGLSAGLGAVELAFATDLQRAHDGAGRIGDVDADLRERLEALGHAHGLTIPEEEP